MTSPLINTLIRNYGVDVNIIYSSMSAIQENTVCYLWLDIQLNDVDRTRIENYFSQQHIEYEEVV